MSASPMYAAAVKSPLSQASTANTARDGTGTLVTAFTPGANGSRIDTIKMKAVSTTTAGMIRLFADDGSVKRLIAEVPVTAVTPSASIPTWEYQMTACTPNGLLPLVLPSGTLLKASTHNAETFNIFITGGDF